MDYQISTDDMMESMDSPEGRCLVVVLDRIHGHVEELVSLSETVPRPIIFRVHV